MENKDTFKEEGFLGSTGEGTAFCQAMSSSAEIFEINESKPKERSGVKFFMPLVVIYLVLLTAGTMLLVVQVLNLQMRLRALEMYFPNGTLAAEDGPTFSLLQLSPPRVPLLRNPADLQVLQAQLTHIRTSQERLLWRVDNFTRNPELFRIKGEQGAPGPKGAPGVPGSPGLPGPPAEKGRDGAPGAPGPQGPPGIKGQAGLQGPKGAPGEPGAIGAPGPQGEKGSRGDMGVTGPQGAAGAKGDKGDPGPQGSKGDVGMKGDAGPMGPAGAQGSKGDTGMPGKTGLVGIPGAKGDRGQPGVQGVPGPPGSPGPSGAKGEPGSTGMTGLTGMPGRPGSPGVMGLKGSKGDPGFQGQKGAKGESGVPGPAGVKGEKGFPGLAGPKGAPGPYGPKGDPGAKGSPGQQGVKGEKGQKGTSFISVRIVGSSHRGRAEIFYNQVWGTICDDDWDEHDATVFCRMLGYSRGRAITSYGGGTGKIWLDNVACQGTEVSLVDCSKNDWGSHNCNHSEDAGVECS